MLPLQQLATAKFGSLTGAEIKLLDAVSTGIPAQCGSAIKTENDPNNASTWPDERTIRSSIVQWLCTDKEALTHNPYLRISVRHARFIGELDLSGTSLGFSLNFNECAFPEGISLPEARLRKLDLAGTVCGNLIAWGLTVEGNMLLRYGFRSHGPVVLAGAVVRGDLECIDAHFGEPTTAPVPELKFELQPNVIFWADRINVGGQIVMTRMKAVGIVSLSAATITSSLDCINADISIGMIMRDTQSRSMNFGGCQCPYLVADRVSVKGSLFLRRGFRSTGSVVLLNSSITGDLDCLAGTFGSQTPDPAIREKAENQFGKLPDAALIANGSVVGGYVFLSHGFQAYGDVDLNGVIVGANLVANGGEFLSEGNIALSCQFSNIKGSVLCRALPEIKKTFRTNGRVRFFGTTVAGSVSFSGAEFFGPASHGLDLQNANIGGLLQWKKVKVTPSTELNLSQLKVAQLEDDEQSWPAAGKLVLDGFRYDAIVNVPLETGRRKTWLKSHLEYLKRQAPNEFSLQPHRQLADILRKSGYEDNARDVMIDLHKARREQGGFSRSGWIWSWVLQATIGFGYRSHRTLLWALGFVILGAFLFNAGYQAGHLVPPKPDVKSQFNAIGYSLDSFLPIINLHQEELFVPTGFGAGRWIQYYYWIHICLGWALITLGVAGFTGLVRKE
ncbi:MAG TPA: hypothetical protein VJS13_13040 [Pyrinomonadaceae bacterium]|nr:hypothetical protein [Pyrinomonadaceae bacterium]